MQMVEQGVGARLLRKEDDRLIRGARRVCCRYPPRRHAGRRFFYAVLCVPKTLFELMTRWNRLSWRNDRFALFRSGRPGLAIQVEVAA
jgi:hypothetical protein